MNTRTSLLASVGCMLAVTSHAAEVRLGQSHEQVIRALGAPTAEWSTQLCPDVHLALYRKPNAILKLAFDTQGRLHAVGFAALRRRAGGGWPALVWPGVAYGIPNPQPYGRQPDLAPWFYNLSSKQLNYYEVQRRGKNASDFTRYQGSVSIDEKSSFASGKGFDFTAADISTRDDSRGTSVSTSSLAAPFRHWRSRTRPNAFVVVAHESAADEGACGGFTSAGVNTFDLRK